MTECNKDDRKSATGNNKADPILPISDNADRRVILKQLGRFAYAAPTLALLTAPKGAQADYGGGGGGPRDG